MTEHEKLKIICDEIGYKYRVKTTQAIKSPFYYNTQAKEFWYDFAITKTDIRVNRSWIHIDYTEYEFIVLDIREIIFTQEFMDKFEAKYENLSWKYWQSALLKNLDNPVEYLYNTIK